MSDYWYMQHGEGEFERGRRPRFDHHVAQHLQPGFVDMTYYVQVGWGRVCMCAHCALSFV